MCSIIFFLKIFYPKSTSLLDNTKLQNINIFIKIIALYFFCTKKSFLSHPYTINPIDFIAIGIGGIKG